MKTCKEVADEYGATIQYEPNGWGKMLCPRHHDTDPSLRIAPDGSHWKCMVCKRGGTAIQLRRWLTGCSFEDAVRDVMDGESGDPLLAYHLRGAPAQVSDLPQRMLAWGMRYSVLTRADVDDILNSDEPGAAIGLLLGV